MKSRRLVLLCLALLGVSVVNARTPSEFTKSLPKESLDALEKDDATKKFLAGFADYAIRVPEPGSKTKVPDHGYFSGTLTTAAGPVEVEGPVLISSGVMQIQLPLDTVVPAVNHWREQYARLPGFEKYSLRLASVEYSEGKEIGAEFEIEGKFGYLLILKTPVDGAAVADVSEDLKFLQKFLKRVEKDKRCQVILGNNRSGRRIFLVLETSGEQGVRAVAHHPMHSIRQFKTEKVLKVSYIDNVEDVKQLKEVKKVLKTKEAKALLQKTGGRGRLTMSGDDQTGYQFTLSGGGAVGELKGTLQKGRASFE